MPSAVTAADRESRTVRGAGVERRVTIGAVLHDASLEKTSALSSWSKSTDTRSPLFTCSVATRLASGHTK